MVPEESRDVDPKARILDRHGLAGRGERVGEIVFNTSLTGYQEILTDPSYHGQIVVLPRPHIGDYGANPDDDESDRAWAAGLVVRAASPMVGNWRAEGSLDDDLHERGTDRGSARAADPPGLPD